MIDRERKIDLKKMPSTEVEQLSVQIGDKVRLICDEAAVKVNQILAIYGMSAKIAIQFDEAPQTEKTDIKSTLMPKKRSARTKKNQKQ